MDLINELQKIYDSEINFEISFMWDSGFDVKLGDRMSGFAEGWNGRQLEPLIKDLITGVLHHFPNSKYAKEFKRPIPDYDDIITYRDLILLGLLKK